jgi:hypothetical protein
MRLDTATEWTLLGREERRQRQTDEALERAREAISELHARGFAARIVICPQYWMDRLSYRTVKVIP